MSTARRATTTIHAHHLGSARSLPLSLWLGVRRAALVMYSLHFLHMHCLVSPTHPGYLSFPHACPRPRGAYIHLSINFVSNKGSYAVTQSSPPRPSLLHLHSFHPSCCPDPSSSTVFVVGGASHAYQRCLPDAWMLNVSTNVWTGLQGEWRCGAGGGALLSPNGEVRRYYYCSHASTSLQVLYVYYSNVCALY